MPQLIQINPRDNVAVALAPIAKGQVLEAGGRSLAAAEEVPQGHKVAIKPIALDEKIVKYGFPIGHATKEIGAGEWVHVHNIATDLSEESAYLYEPNAHPLEPVEPETFQGYQRENGQAGVRNELWVIPTVGCVNDICERLARQNQDLVAGSVEGLYAFPHPYGCSQMGEDHENTKKLLAALARHPNAGAVLVVALGCENVTLEQFQKALGDYNPDRIRFMVCQEEADELAKGRQLLDELAAYAGRFRREPVPISKLVVGMKCGGSDGLSGITANPTVGAFSDLLIARGGSTVLTEVPEMFGAEGLLMNRAVNRAVFEKAVNMVDSFKQYFTDHGQVVYENPSPGNKQGGISTLEDKSLGCVQKGGAAPVTDVIAYGEGVTLPGLTLLSGPGNDLVSATALSAAGVHMVLFTTGRGTPFGAPAPTVKIASNTALYKKKGNWIDFNAGPVAEGEPLESAARRLLELVLEIASGERRTRAEEHGYRGISIFKDGVIL